MAYEGVDYPFFHEAWVFQIAIIALITLGIHVVFKLVYNKVIGRLENSHQLWDDVLLRAFSKPFLYFIWIYSICSIAHIVSEHLHDYQATFSIIPHLRFWGSLLVVVWFFMRFISGLEVSVMQACQRRGKCFDKTTIIAIGKTTRVLVLVLAALVGMQTYGVSISGLLAFGGIGGIALSFASKDMLANFFGGWMIFLDRPFAVGDDIRSLDKTIEGKVEDIGWRVTRIRTPEKKALYIPNSVFSQISIENATRIVHKRIKAFVGVRYTDAKKVVPIVNEIREYLKNHTCIDKKEDITTNLDNFGDSSLNILIQAFTKVTDGQKFQALQEEIFIKAIEIIENHGARCAFPTRTLDITDSNISKIT